MPMAAARGSATAVLRASSSLCAFCPQQRLANSRGRWRPLGRLTYSSLTDHPHSEAAASTAQSTTESSTAWQRKDLHVVMVHPQIPQNTGNVARTCAATATGLHLVGPLGFDLDDKKLKRAGLDYWPHVCVDVHDSWEVFFKYFQQQPDPKRLVAYTVYGSTFYGAPDFQYKSGDWLVFGAETTGLPEVARRDIMESGGAMVKIPIINDTYVRSLNLAVSAGVGVFEALRQIDASCHEVQPRAK